jgi:hypothetical protein
MKGNRRRRRVGDRRGLDDLDRRHPVECEVGAADRRGQRVWFDRDVADAGRRTAALHREPADVGAQFEHRCRVPAERAPPGQQFRLPTLDAAPVQLLEHLRVDGHELQFRVVDQTEAVHAAGDATPREHP